MCWLKDTTFTNWFTLQSHLKEKVVLLVLLPSFYRWEHWAVTSLAQGHEKPVFGTRQSSPRACIALCTTFPLKQVKRMQWHIACNPRVCLRSILEQACPKKSWVTSFRHLAAIKPSHLPQRRDSIMEVNSQGGDRQLSILRLSHTGVETTQNSLADCFSITWPSKWFFLHFPVVGFDFLLYKVSL